MSENYNDAPVSVAELRSDKSGDGSQWTPRDALISTLRAIDKGELKPTALIICMCEEGDEPGSSITTFRNATPNPLIAYGLLAHTILRIGAFSETRK